MRRQILLASVGAIAIAGSAFAADLTPPAPPPVYVPPPPVFTWTGLYMGGQIGYAWGNDPIDVADVGVPDGFFDIRPTGVIGGAHVGYDLQIGPWVAGLEGTVDGTSIQGTTTSAGVPDVTIMPIARPCRVRSASAPASPSIASSSTAPAAPPSPASRMILKRPARPGGDRFEDPLGLDGRRRHRIRDHQQLVDRGRIPLLRFRP